MRRVMIMGVFTLVATAAAGDTHADDCSALGLANDYLADHFCAQLDTLVQPSEATRSIVPEGDPDLDMTPVAPWETIGLIQDAYRADPRKTLELIERIKGAGGLAGEMKN